MLPSRVRPVPFGILAVYVLPAFLWWSYATWIEHLIGDAIGVALGAWYGRRDRQAWSFTRGTDGAAPA